MQWQIISYPSLNHLFPNFPSSYGYGLVRDLQIPGLSLIGFWGHRTCTGFADFLSLPHWILGSYPKFNHVLARVMQMEQFFVLLKPLCCCVRGFVQILCWYFLIQQGLRYERLWSWSTRLMCSLAIFTHQDKSPAFILRSVNSHAQFDYYYY
jgi:hypothetical protein